MGGEDCDCEFAAILCIYMGGAAANLRKEEIAELMRSTQFSQKELKRVYRRFLRLDQGAKGYVSVDDLQTLQELANHPLGDRIARMLAPGVQDHIDFRLFAQMISYFSSKGDPENRLRFFFQIYDIDQDGFVNDSELFVILKMVVKGVLSDDQVQQIVEKVIEEADRDKDGKLSMEEFRGLLAGGIV